MAGTDQKSILAGHVDSVSERMKAGEPFGTVEDLIDQLANLNMDQKAALWLFAFSLRDRSEQELDARIYLATVQ
jgi:hypothetical protein